MIHTASRMGANLLSLQSRVSRQTLDFDPVQPKRRMPPVHLHEPLERAELSRCQTMPCSAGFVGTGSVIPRNSPPCPKTKGVYR